MEEYLPIYKKLINQYVEDIKRHVFAPGKQIDSINKIMIKHKVSRETAKIVLTHLSKLGLIVKIPGKGSFVKEVDKLINKWGLILPMYSSNMEELTSKIFNIATEFNMTVEYYFHYNNPDEEIRLVSSLVKKGFSSLFIVPNYNEAVTSSFYQDLDVGNSRLFLVDHTMAGSSFNYVIQSYDLGVKRASEYLAEKQKGNILFVKDSGWRGINMIAESMFASLEHYCETLYKREVFVINHHNEITKEYITENNIGGIIFSKDTDAINGFGKIIKAGFKIPQEISLVNYGNTDLIQLFGQGITTIDCLYDEMVEQIRVLYINNSEIKEQHVVLPKLIIRNT